MLLAQRAPATAPLSHEGVLAQLRARIGTPRVLPGRLPTGLAALDAWLGGWPTPGLTEVSGEQGAGRLALVMPALERLTRQGRSVVVVDPLQVVHPPGMPGIVGEKLVLVRPPSEQAAWVAEQVARSGAVDAMVLLDPPPLGRAGLRLARAAEGGGMACFLLTRAVEGDVPAALRLVVEGWEEGAVRVHCVRSRDGRHEGRRLVRGLG